MDNDTAVRGPGGNRRTGVRYTSAMHTYEYPRPALTADTVVLRDAEGLLEVLLIKRRQNPFAGQWALPGGFVDEYEAPVDAARRELAEETGLVCSGEFVLLGVFSERGRDPRGWTVACAFVTVLDDPDSGLVPADDACEARWFPAVSLPPVAFDHQQIVASALANF